MGRRDLYVRYEEGWPVGCMTAAEWAEARGCDEGSVRFGATPTAHARAAARRGGEGALYERVGTKARVRRELPEGAIRMMSRISGVTLGNASVALGRTIRCLDNALREADATRARGTGRPCGPKAETLAAVARVMGFRLALVGHGHVIEVVPGEGLARGGRR